MTSLDILIIRPDNLGDIILFSGMLRHIREIYPQAKITLCVKKSLIEAIELCPFIDKIIEYEKFSKLPLPWLPNFKGKYKINWWIRRMLNLKYKTDILLLPVRSTKAGIFNIHSIVSSIRAHKKIGITGDRSNQSKKEDKKKQKIYSTQLQLKSNQYNTHELEINKEYLNFLGAGISTKDVWPELWTDKNDRKWANKAITINNNLITIAICPGVTSTSGKFYPGEKYATAISRITSRKFQIVLFGAPSEEKMCKEVENELTKCKKIESIYNFCGKTTIRQMIEGIKKCDVLISQETGALHIGVALKKPTIGILGGGHYGRFYPWGSTSINYVVNKKMNCYGCNWNCIYPTIKCIQEISDHAITEQLKTIISQIKRYTTANENFLNNCL